MPEKPTAQQVVNAVSAAEARYPGSLPALIWLCNALELSSAEPTAEEIAWARAEMALIEAARKVPDEDPLSEACAEIATLRVEIATLRERIARMPAPLTGPDIFGPFRGHPTT